MGYELGVISNARRSTDMTDIPSLRFDVTLLLGETGVCIPWEQAKVLLEGMHSLDNLNGRGCIMDEDPQTEKLTFVRLR